MFLMVKDNYILEYATKLFYLCEKLCNVECILKNSYINFIMCAHFLYFPGKINRYSENKFPATYFVVCDFFEYILSISNKTHTFTILLPYILIARYFQKVFLFKVCILFGITSDQF